MEIDLDYYADLRRELHQIPEIGYEEFKTSERIVQELERLGIEYYRGLAGTGIVAWIRKGKAERSIALRADMDGLPIEERSGVAYASRHPGMMHACGHDGHCTMLLAAAEMIKREVEFDGTVYLIFQPAEEGGAGAKRMIEDGLFDRFAIDEIYGMHNRPSEELGKFLVRQGPVMSAVDHWKIVVEGSAGHSSQPHRTVNPIVAASHIVLAIKEISATAIDPIESHVITVAKIESGTAFNVVPGSCRIEGSVRSFSGAVQNRIEESIRSLAGRIAEGFGAEALVDYQRIYPPTVNTRSDVALAAAAATVGEENIDREFPSSMGSEDFSFYLQHVPGAYVWIGSRPDEGPTPTLHSDRYDFNDAVIPIGARYWANLVKERLGEDRD